MSTDHIYNSLLRDVLSNGQEKKDRTGTGVLSVFGRQVRFDLTKKFPILTTKKIHWKSVVEELLWFIRGETNIKSLNEKGVTIWNEWASPTGNLGPIYGEQWRYSFGMAADGRTVRKDQLLDVQDQIRDDPNSRRLIISSWNVAQIEDMALPPCHCLFQFYVSNGELSCQLYQRSADLFLGVPFNISSYALLTYLVAASCDLKVGEFIHTFGDLHLYANHIEQAKTQLERQPKQPPRIEIVKKECVSKYTSEDIRLVGYNPHPAIKAQVAV